MRKLFWTIPIGLTLYVIIKGYLEKDIFTLLAGGFGYVGGCIIMLCDLNE